MIISITLWANLFFFILSNFGRSQSFECSTTIWPPTQWHWNFGNMAWPHCLEMKHFKCIPAKQTIRNTDNVQWDVEKDGAINIKSKYRLNNNWIHVKLIVVFYSIPSTDSRENKYFRYPTQSKNNRLPSQYKGHRSRYMIHIMKIKRFYDCLIFLMGMRKLVKWHLYIETPSRTYQ